MDDLELDKLWEKVLVFISNHLNPEDISLWFTDVKLICFENNILTFSVPNKFFQEWIENNCSLLFQNYFYSNFGIDVKTKYEFNAKNVRDNLALTSERLPEKVYNKNKIENPFNEKYTFYSFVIGKNNNFAYAVSEAVAKDPGEVYNPLFIYGGPGLGKTHLLHAIGNYIFMNNPNNNILYITAEKFMNDLIDSIKSNKSLEFQKKYRNADVLLVDDVQFLSGKDSTQEAFFHTFNALYDKKKQIVLSSDVMPKKIPNLVERLCSRFEWGVVAEVKPPDNETRIAILEKKASILNKKIPKDVFEYIASKIKINIRRLEGYLNRIVAYSNVYKKDIDINLTKVILNDVETEILPSQMINIKDIQEITAKFYNIRLDDMLSKKRSANIAQPRQVAIYIAREILSNMSITEIGRNFGGRDHTTVMHAYKKISEKIKVDPYFNSYVNKIISKIRENS